MFTEESGLKPLPGFGLDIDELPPGHFPLLLGDENDTWRADTLLVREVCMLRLIEDITNKPEWWLNVNDPEVVARWREEALRRDWAAYIEYGNFTEEMADFCIEELRHKAVIYQETNLIPVMDYSSCVIKSDSLIPSSLIASLKQAVKPLEDVPDHLKDWHPGTDGKVLDLVHPSLWPLVYNRSRIIPDRRIGLDEALDRCGEGIVVPPARDSEGEGDRLRGAVMAEMTALGTVCYQYQWLPCNVLLDADGHGTPRIESYINNLHPKDHAALYPIIESFIHKSLPAWDVVYRWHEEFKTQRFKPGALRRQCTVPDDCKRSPHGACCKENRPYDPASGSPADNERKDWAWWARTHPLMPPDLSTPPGQSQSYTFGAKDVKTSSGFFGGAERIQVIVKLANIHLTPEKPSYDGGDWHVEGQLNEHICATALFYYDADNITDNHVGFSTLSNTDDLNSRHGHDDPSSLERVYHISPRTGDDPPRMLQHIGPVFIRPGRALFLPNLFQNRVARFRLADPTRPGHRKVLALFLVDPAAEILSTANVPPQQKHWWTRAAGLDTGLDGRLPPELAKMVSDNVDFPFDEAEAKKIRKDLVYERTVLQEILDDGLRAMEFNFSGY